MTPRVRVVVVDYNGGDLTLDCLRSLVATDWPADALELVLVDNASPQPVIDRVVTELPSVRVIRAAENLGFGAGCNLGLHDLDAIDFVALVNNDATVPADWLAPLVDAFADPHIGAACPKILFRDRYHEIALDAPLHHRRFDRHRVGIRVEGARSAGRDLWPRVRFRSGFWGPEFHTGGRVTQWTGTGDPAVLLVPESSEPIELRLSAPRPVRATISTGNEHHAVDVTPTPQWHTVPSIGPAVDVIQNVGNELCADGYARDRGFLEVERGQYDQPTEVFAWCGAAVLLSTKYLHEVGRFHERLFLYYEDIDLAWRGRHGGWRYVTAPRSTIRHLHSATTGASVLRTTRLNERNHLVVLTRNGTRRQLAVALVHHLLATASYAYRDLLAPALRGEKPNGHTVATRARALLEWLMLLPAARRM